MKTLFIFIVVAVLVSSFFVLIPLGMNRQEKIDCYKWQKWEQQDLGDFTPSKEMKDGCELLGIEL